MHVVLQCETSRSTLINTCLFQELVADLKVDHIKISYGEEVCIVVTLENVKNA